MALNLMQVKYAKRGQGELDLWCTDLVGDHVGQSWSVGPEGIDCTPTFAGQPVLNRTLFTVRMTVAFTGCCRPDTGVQAISL